MSVIVAKEPDVYVTANERAVYAFEYKRAFTHYAGPVPSFEEYIRQRQLEEHAMRLPPAVMRG